MLTGIFRNAVAAAALLVLLLGSGCSPQTVTHPTPPPPTPTLTSIVVTAPTAVVSVGQTIQLSATAKYSDGSAEDVTSKAQWGGGWLNWGEPPIFTVSAGGIVKGERVGTADATARYGMRGDIAITVVP